MNGIRGNEGIEVRSVATCYLCGTEGYELYRGLRDRLFGAPGSWDLRRCPNSKCGLIWLDPMPTETDIHRLYATYYTHQPRAVKVVYRAAWQILMRKLLAARKRMYYSL